MKQKVFIGIMLALFLSMAVFEYQFEAEIKEWFQADDQSVFMQDDKEEAIAAADEIVVETAPVENENESKTTSTTGNFESDEPLLGAGVEEVKELFGEPSRIDPSAFGYDWWVYEEEDYYHLIGIEQEQVVTTFTSWSELNSEETMFGESYQTLDERYTFTQQVELRAGGNHYQFELTPEDRNMRPIVEVDDGWMQLYFDIHTNELSSIRYLTDEVLLKQRPYSVSYRGALPEEENVKEAEWEEIEAGQARHIFSFTNVLRERHGLEPFTWNGEVSDVAYLHSRDMQEEQYFSHTSPIYGELSDRFDRGELNYRLAGENIAAQYVDGLAATEGWLNSEGHRVNVLHEEFEELGVGVYKDFYTQNFMTGWGF
ncbi:CAP domain-containing protein [Alkalihalophilus pseudofirmus]|uniref:CAP domain-containing protein n=1 Tax=Alkalihalophilus pseudofirmus TaxID=79885 RepID=UPI00259B709C|nr:CAP domain-containing protein [Alkalihalophilus pseudofirmus]WEG15747.1 CAP domain-containing protein [Alkalihalophilus pseudofirmus]